MNSVYHYQTLRNYHRRRYPHLRRYHLEYHRRYNFLVDSHLRLVRRHHRWHRVRKMGRVRNPVLYFRYPIYLFFFAYPSAILLRYQNPLLSSFSFYLSNCGHPYRICTTTQRIRSTQAHQIIEFILVHTYFIERPKRSEKSYIFG